MTLFPRSKTQSSLSLAQLLFLVSISEWNVLWEVFSTSETEQEGGILTSAAECLTHIRLANASQTKTGQFVRSTRILHSIPLADPCYVIIPIRISVGLVTFDLD